MFSLFLSFCIKDRSLEEEQQLKEPVSFEEDLQLNKCRMPRFVKMLFMAIHSHHSQPAIVTSSATVRT
jgi:hypothetical protein